MACSVKKMAIFYGNERIEFERGVREGVATRVLIKVHPDCRVVVNAPLETADADVIDAVKKRSRWIYKKIERFKGRLAHITPRQYIGGESHYYLGKKYVLKVSSGNIGSSCVKLSRGKLEIICKTKSKAEIKKLLDGWYRERAREIFDKRLEEMLSKALWVKHKPEVRLRVMKTQWGNCSPNGRLSINPFLVKAPRECIDYVILHELCHIAEHNHSVKFYRLMKKVMPEWEKVKKKLDGMSEVILTN